MICVILSGEVMIMGATQHPPLRMPRMSFLRSAVCQKSLEFQYKLSDKP